MSLYPSGVAFVLKRPWLQKLLMPLANWYVNASGYRQVGLKADDLLMEEDDDVQAALRRLPPQEAYDRVYRIRRAMQCSLSHQLLPKDQWTKDEDDVRYLMPLILQIKAENKEREALDTLVMEKKKK